MEFCIFGVVPAQCIRYPSFQIAMSQITMAEKKVASDTATSASPDIVAGDIEPQGFDQAATKKLLRKLDWHIIPFMSLIYL